MAYTGLLAVHVRWIQTPLHLAYVIIASSPVLSCKCLSPHGQFLKIPKEERPHLLKYWKNIFEP